MANKWLEHVKKFWSAQKGKMSYAQALKEAKKTYKKAPAAIAPKKKGKKKSTRSV